MTVIVKRLGSKPRNYRRVVARYHLDATADLRFLECISSTRILDEI